MRQNLTSCQPLPLLLERQILVKKCKDLADKRLRRYWLKRTEWLQETQKMRFEET
jgi:hypothetical protein